MKRRALVQSLLTPDAPPREATGPAAGPSARVPSGAVRAMGLELDKLDLAAREGEALRRQIDAGAVVMELDAQQVDPSFVADRLARTADAEYRRLVDSLRESGQQVPILVRPHPGMPGRYQIAYGHRRRDAALELGKTVRAIIRTLSDQELVVAQGKENAERRDLSFIERALFAANLERQGLGRATANAALGVHTAEMTRLLAVAAAIPHDIIHAIGPAPKAGRPRWMELARLIEGRDSEARSAAQQPSFAQLASDRRFEALLTLLRANAVSAEPMLLRNARGEVLVRAEQVSKSLRIAVDDRLAPGFGRFLVDALPALLARFEETGKA